MMAQHYAWRSALFVPASDRKRISKVSQRGADLVILDLEDGVATGRKREARDILRQHVTALDVAGIATAVRVNGDWLSMHDDLSSAVTPGLRAVIIPKSRCPHALQIVSQMLSEWESARGVAIDQLKIIALIEDAQGLSAAQSIAALPRVCALALGTEDFALSMAVAPTPSVLDLPARQIALAAASHAKMAFAMPISIADFRDEHRFRLAAEEARRFGATGALCVHPIQVALANSAFGIDDLAVAEAAALLHHWDAEGGDALGAIEFRGGMIDRPVVERARNLLRQVTRPI
jgi:citrate lyase subunit beta/citryl-CoA lyase